MLKSPVPIIRRLVLSTIFVTVVTGCGRRGEESAASNSSKSSNQSLDQPGAISRVAPYPNSGVLLGQGWNTSTEYKAPAACINFGTADDSGQDVFLDLTNVVDNSQMIHELNISASASYNAVAAGGSAKVSFAQRVQIKDDHDYFIAHSQVVNGAHYVVPPGLSLAKQSLSSGSTIVKPGMWDARDIAANGRQIDLSKDYVQLAASDPIIFFKTCGDSFVSVIHDGAELIARLQIDAHSIDDKRTLSTSLEGSYAGATLSVQASDTLQKLQTNHQLNIVYFQSGGSGDPVATDKDALLAIIKNLAGSAKASPRPFVITVQRYDSLPNWPKHANDIAHSLEAMGSQYERFKTLYDEAEFTKNNQSLFILNRGVTVDQIEATQDRLKERLNSINAQINRCTKTNADGDCNLSVADSVSDYSFRVLFPVRLNSFTDDVQLSALRAQLGNQNQELAKVQQMPDSMIAFGSTFDFRASKAAKMNPIKQQIAATNQQISSLEASYPASLKQAILEQLIGFPSSTRCKLNLQDVGCLSNSEISSWATKIAVQ